MNIAAAITGMGGDVEGGTGAKTGAAGMSIRSIAAGDEVVMAVSVGQSSTQSSGLKLGGEANLSSGWLASFLQARSVAAEGAGKEVSGSASGSALRSQMAADTQVQGAEFAGDGEGGRKQGVGDGSEQNNKLVIHDHLPYKTIGHNRGHDVPLAIASTALKLAGKSKTIAGKGEAAKLAGRASALSAEKRPVLQRQEAKIPPSELPTSNPTANLPTSEMPIDASIATPVLAAPIVCGEDSTSGDTSSGRKGVSELQASGGLVAPSGQQVESRRAQLHPVSALPGASEQPVTQIQKTDEDDADGRISLDRKPVVSDGAALLPANTRGEVERNSHSASIVPSFDAGGVQSPAAQRKSPIDAPSMPASPKQSADLDALTSSPNGAELPHKSGKENAPLAPHSATALSDIPATVRVPLAQHAESSRVSVSSSPSVEGAGGTFAALDTPTRVGAPAWTAAAGQHAEAGFQDPTLGWIHVRADLNGGSVHAALVPATAEAATALEAHLGGLNAHLTEARTAVSSLTIDTGIGGGGNQSLPQGGGDHDRRSAADARQDGELTGTLSQRANPHSASEGAIGGNEIHLRSENSRYISVMA